MTAADFSKKWEIRYRDNDTFLIAPADLREFKDDLLLVFGLQGVNVPLYSPTKTYDQDYLVRFTLDGGKESFYYSLQSGKLPAPTGATDTNWKVVPGPVAAVAFSQELTLAEAQSIEGTDVVPGRTYLIDFGPDANSNAQVVTVRGVNSKKFDVQGTLEVAGVLTPIEAFDVQAGSWQVRSTTAQVLVDANTYTDSQLVWRFIGDPWDNNISQGLFSATNTLADATDMEFGAYCFNIKLKEGAYSSRIGAFANTLLARERFAFNVIGDYLSGLVVGQDFGHNTLGNYVANVSAGNSCQFNTFGDNVNGASLGIGVTFCTIGNGCRGVILGDGCEHVEVYNCYDQFTVPAGTKNAVYRNNKLENSGASGPNYTDTQARAAQLGRTAPAGTTTVTLTAEAPTDYGTAASGTFTVDATGCVVDKVARFGLGAGASGLPVFQNVPASQPVHYYGTPYAPGKDVRVSICVCVDELQVVVAARL